MKGKSKEEQWGGRRKEEEEQEKEKGEEQEKEKKMKVMILFPGTIHRCLCLEVSPDQPFTKPWKFTRSSMFSSCGVSNAKGPWKAEFMMTDLA